MTDCSSQLVVHGCHVKGADAGCQLAVPPRGYREGFVEGFPVPISVGVHKDAIQLQQHAQLLACLAAAASSSALQQLTALTCSSTRGWVSTC